MDWNYLFSIVPENLTEDEKDDLYNTITWLNIHSEKLDAKKSATLLLISQEILKFKGEQVEVLLHELDELATQQGENEVRLRLESDNDARSSKSLKSSSLEFENFEHNYLELKAKHKKQIRINEKNAVEINNLKKQIINLEKDKNRLINEMQLINQDGNQSDGSENVKEQHKELIDTLQNKNKQISDLLRDIEETDQENIILRDKLATTRDELKNATIEIVDLTENHKTLKQQLDNATKTINKLSAEQENIQDELQDTLAQRNKFEQEMEGFTEEVNVRVDEWKNILEEKEKEIFDLKSRKIKTSHHSSLSSISLDNEQRQSHVSVLNKILLDRENQLMEVKSQLQEAVKEMEQTTSIIQNMTKQIGDKDQNIENLSESVKQLQMQLQTAHGRCQDLQDNLAEAEEDLATKDNELKNFIEELNDSGKIELADVIADTQKLKVQTRIQEKHIRSLVKASNKLQDLSDQYEKDNEILRERLGINPDEILITNEITSKKKYKKEIDSLKNQINDLEEEKLVLKMDNRTLSRRLSKFCKQIDVVESQKLLNLKSNNKQENKFEPEVSTTNQFQALVEENEALRKGMHEILDNLNTKKESSVNELKSETFEKLLRALDVKHISGWYHPAMRLQAELHNLEGINSELREQLRLVRLEVQTLKTSTDNAKTNDIVDTAFDTLIGQKINDTITFNNIYKKLESFFVIVEQETSNQDELESKLMFYKNNFIQIRQQIGVLYTEYQKEKQILVDQVSEYEEKLQEIEENNIIKTEQLSLLSKDRLDHDIIKKSLELTKNNIILRRKCYYLENELKQTLNQMSSLQKEYSDAQNAYLKKINESTKIKMVLSNKIRILTNSSELCIDCEVFHLLRNDLDALTIKHRNLLSDYAKIGNANEFELKMFGDINKNLKQEKCELERKILEISELLNNCKCSNNVDENDGSADLAKKLAISQTNEINERQRANHTNNLFELVKEQLQKSEDRCKQCEKYNKELLERNVFLQEQLRDSENRIIDFIDPKTYKDLLDKFNEHINNNEKLALNFIDLKNELDMIKNKYRTNNIWSKEKEQELLNLKHQIVDLQAISDDKMQLARLSSELSHMRLSETEYNRKIEFLNDELRFSNEKYNDLLKEFEFKCTELAEKETDFRRKNRILRELLEKSKLQYLGSIPLPSEQHFITNLKKIINDRHQAFIKFYKAESLITESSVIKEQYEKALVDLERALKLNLDAESVRELFNWHQEKKRLQFREVKYRRQCELKETQLQHVFDRVKIQDEQIIKLEEDLFTMHKNVSFDLMDSETFTSSSLEPVRTIVESHPIKITKPKETQTDLLKENLSDLNLNSIKIDLIKVTNDVALKDQTIQQLKTKIDEYESNISLFRKQLGDKQSQITFYERHILELQSKKEKTNPENISKLTNESEELITLKCSLKLLQDNFKQKEEEIIHYQSLLKEDRDKHSMAASLMREELNMLQKCLNEEKENVFEIKSTLNVAQPSKAALEEYFLQVHSLEDELSDLRTKVSSLESQLEASRQEAVRWRILANDRLESMQKLGHDLEELHKNEITTYKNESEKWREEVTNLKQLITRYRTEMSHDFEFQRILKDKEDKIHELTVMLRHSKTNTKRDIEKTVSLSKMNELELDKDQLIKEHETLKQRFDQLLFREKSARDEIRELKNKLMKKPILSTRSDKNDKSIKEQLQKKINSLENEIDELKANLSRQITLNESHKIRISEDFDRWNKQKHWQQTADKLKMKLKIKGSDLEKLQQTCSGYRLLIERLEREKYSLENKIKSLKNTNNQTNYNELEMLRLENIKLISENELLISKLEMQHHHAGGLGAAMLQEKLEGQERKIAILEVSAKGTVEVRSEIERLQSCIANLQKQNLCLNAENLELKLDLEKSMNDVPHLREQIQHLENYIEVLKRENNEATCSEADGNIKSSSNKKNVAELERTVFVLKRVVEKLQTENKRLLSGKRPFPDRSISLEKLRHDHQKLKEQYLESMQKVAKLERELVHTIQNKPVSDTGKHSQSGELDEVREQLQQKSHLLTKVKVLLQRAAAKEKSLLQQINMLQIEKEKNSEAKSDL